MFTIRKATLDDAHAIAAVHVGAWKETYRGIISEQVLDSLSTQRRMEQWVSALSEPSHTYHHTFVAEMGGRVLGFANYGAPQIMDAGFDAELFALYILRIAQKQGVGRHLVNAVVDALQGSGHNSMMVWVLKDNPARGFYERLGGAYLYERTIDISVDTLLEIAYGWRNLREFQR